MADDTMNDKEEIKGPTYRQLMAQVGVLSKMLRAYQTGEGKFDRSGRLTEAVLAKVPREADEIVRKNQRMEWTLTRVRQSFYSLIHAEALPSEGWDYAAKEMIDSIEKALAMNEKEEEEIAPSSQNEDS